MPNLPSKRATTYWNVLFNYISIAITITSGVVLVPLYLERIPLELYGLWLATGNILAWMTIVDPGLSTVVMQRLSVAYAARDLDRSGELIASGLVLSAVLALLSFVFGLLFSILMVGNLNVSSDSYRLELMVSFHVANIGNSLMIFSYGITSCNQGLQSSLGIGTIYVLVAVIALAASVLLIYMNYGLLALAFAILIRGAGFSVCNILYLAWRIRKESLFRKLNLGGCRELVNLMAFTAFGSTASTIASNIEPYFLAQFVTPQDASIVALTRRSSDILRLLIERPILAMVPSLSAMVGEGRESQLKQLLLPFASAVVWLCGLASAGLLLLNESFVRIWVGSFLYAGTQVNIALTFLAIVSILSTTLSNVAVASGEIQANSLIKFLQSVASILLMVAGLYFFGVLGLVVGNILAVTAISLSCLTILVFRRLSFTMAEGTSLMKECVWASTATLICCLVFQWELRASIIEFVMNAVLISLVYSLVLAVCSSSCRKSCNHIFRTFSLRRQS